MPEFIIGVTIGTLASMGVMMYLSKGLMMTVEQIQNRLEVYSTLANKVLQEVEAANDRSKDFTKSQQSMTNTNLKAIKRTTRKCWLRCLKKRPMRKYRDWETDRKSVV